jgi:hypothetical protein
LADKSGPSPSTSGGTPRNDAHEVIQNGEMRLIKVPTSAQPAAMLTKGLHPPQSTMWVEGILGCRRTSSLKGTSVLQRGRV